MSKATTNYHSMADKEPRELPSTNLAASTAESIGADLSVLRASFRQGKLRPVENRKRILRQIQTLIKEGTPLLEEACLRDLNKHPMEFFVMELAGIHAELQEHLDHLDDWTAPEKVSTNLVNLPGSSYIVSDPLGVCCIIDTWNYPVSLLFGPLIGCIGAGNCALVRLPPEGTCDHVTAVVASLLDKYVDSDVVRYVVGGIESNIAMLKHKFDLIFVTGGTTIGKIVARAAAETLTPIVLELGGKSPCIVDGGSLDLNVAATRIAWGAFANTGQTCLRPDYLLVHSSVGDRLVSLVIEKLVQFFGTDPEQSDSYGRVVNATQHDRLKAIIDSDRAFLVHGGDTNAATRYIAPTLLNFKTNLNTFEESAAMQGELFGPVLPILYYDNLDSVVDIVTSRPKPLALYIFSNNKHNIERVRTETSSGSLCINDVMAQNSNSALPFGGVGNSGMGSYHGKHSFKTFSHQKAVLWKSTMLDFPQRYMPYSESKASFLRLTMKPITRTQTRVLLVVGLIVIAAIVVAIVLATTKK
ncbi:unnamed protein product [Aphanomyces euteiches]